MSYNNSFIPNMVAGILYIESPPPKEGFYTYMLKWRASTGKWHIGFWQGTPDDFVLLNSKKNGVIWEAL